MTSATNKTAITEDRAIGEVGLAMLAAGYAVTDVATSLNRIIKTSGDGELSANVLPAAILTDSAEHGARVFGQASGTSLSWDQACKVGELSSAAAAHKTAPADMWADVQRIRAMPSRYGMGAAILGSALMSGGIAVVFGTSLRAVALAFVLGLGVGATMLWAGKFPRLSAILPLLCGFVVSALVIGLGEHIGLGHAPLYAVCAPLVMLIPGATITNAVIELAGGDMVSGGGRMCAGLLTWAMLALGVIAGAAAVGADLNELAKVPAVTLPGWAPWLGLLFMAVGVGLFFSAPFSLMLIIAVVLELTYAVVSLGEIPWNSVVASGLAAALILPACRALQYYLPGLPAIVTFRPAFWLLVPGSLGVVSFTELGAHEAGTSVLLPLVATVVAISAGVQVGAMLSELLVPAGHHQRQHHQAPAH